MKKAAQYKKATTNNKSFKKSGIITGRAKGYDSDWEKYRIRFLYHNPDCYACGQKSKHVDHIRRVRGNEALFKDLNNHLPLCASCHSIVTGKFDCGAVQDLEGKIKWLRDQRSVRGIKTGVKVLNKY